MSHYFYKGKRVSRTFTKQDLPPGIYEVRVTAGSIVSKNGESPSDRTITGKTSSGYEEAYRVELPEGGAPWDIEITRVTADSSSSKIQNRLFWQSYTEIIDEKLSYPNSAIVGLAIDSKVFGNSIPQRSYEMKGLIVQLPSNYDPETRVYTGVWDGTFKRAWTDNPAWCLYDLLINKRYGLGLDPLDIDKWAFYQISKYCDELVDDGFGGQEPRYTLNCVIQTREEAYAVINTITSVFRGMVYWASGAITVSQDAPADPDRLVTPANVINGEFNYSGTALKARHNAALVQWVDPDEDYRSTVVMAEDAEDILKFGYRPSEVVAFGTTTKGQANRLGRWLIDTERTATETVTYRAGLDHADLAPGKIIAVADPDFAGVRMGGRIKTVNVVVGPTETTTEITTDTPVTIESGQTYILSVVLPDQQIVRVTVNNAPGPTSVLTTTDTLPELPLANAMWVLTASNLEPRQFRVLANMEVKPNVFEITALLHDPGKYVRIEEQLELDPPPVTQLASGPLAAPGNLAITEFLHRSGTEIASGVSVSWTPSQDTRVRFYDVEIRRPGRDWERIGQTSLPSMDLRDTEAGEYGFRVRALDGFGRTSPFLSVESYILEGLTAPPADVKNLVSVVQNGQTVLIWDEVADLRPISYEIRKGFDFKTAQTLDKISGSRQYPAVGDGTYWVIAKTAQASSVNPASIVIEGSSLFANVVAERDEGLTGWRGQLSGAAVVLHGVVILAGTGDIRLAPDIRAVPDIVFMGGIGASGTYQIPADRVVDLGETQVSQVTINYEMRGEAPNQDIRDVPDIRALSSIRGDFGDFVSAATEIRTAGDDELWSEWRAFRPGFYTARKYDLRITLATSSPDVTAVLDKFVVSVDMPDRFERGTAIAVPIAGSDIAYPKNFQIVPNLQVTIVGAQPGDDLVVTAQTRVGFHVEVVNGGGGAAREINYLAQGY